MFGFAQSLEQTASPLSAFFVSPLAQFVVIPFMSTGAGARLIGAWYGTGPERGIALLYTVAGLLGMVLTVIATRSRRFRELAAAVAERRVGGLDAEPARGPLSDYAVMAAGNLSLWLNCGPGKASVRL